MDATKKLCCILLLRAFYNTLIAFSELLFRLHVNFPSEELIFQIILTPNECSTKPMWRGIILQVKKLQFVVVSFSFE